LTADSKRFDRKSVIEKRLIKRSVKIAALVQGGIYLLMGLFVIGLTLFQSQVEELEISVIGGVIVGILLLAAAGVSLLILRQSKRSIVLMKIAGIVNAMLVLLFPVFLSGPLLVILIVLILATSGLWMLNIAFHGDVTSLFNEP